MKRKPKTWQSVKIYLLAGQLISTSHISCCQEFKLPPVFGFISHAWTLDSQIILTSLVANSYLYITLEKFWRRNKITPKYDFLMSLTRRERARATFDFSGDQMWPNPLLLTRNIQQKLAIKSKRNRSFWEILNIIVDPGDYFALRWRE